jgi:xylan 1,4-beta-xylosidase
LHTGGCPTGEGRVKMRLDVNNSTAAFSFCVGGKTWTRVGPEVDASKLSDDYVAPMGFTGAFVGMACQDLQNRSAVARFHSFRYEPK